jgi:hypothetical protein
MLLANLKYCFILTDTRQLAQYVPYILLTADILLAVRGKTIVRESPHNPSRRISVSS